MRGCGISNRANEVLLYLLVHTLDRLHDHPGSPIRSELCNECVVWVDPVLLHCLCIEWQLNLGADEIGTAIGLNNERVCAELREWIAS